MSKMSSLSYSLLEINNTIKYRFPGLLGFCLRILGLWPDNGSEPCDSPENAMEGDDIPMQVLTISNNHPDGESHPLLQTKYHHKEAKTTFASVYKIVNKILRKFLLLLWLAIPTVLLILMTADLLVYLSSLWGRQADTLFIVSYSITYIPQLGIIPVMCLFVRIRSYFQRPLKNHPPFVLTREYFIMRTACLRLKNKNAEPCLSGGRCKDVLIFAVLVFWPTVNIAIIFFNYFRFEATTCSTYMIFSKVAAGGGLGLYGCFCYVIFKLRQSHNTEFMELTDAIESEGLSIDAAKARVRRAFNEYRGFRNLVGTWTTFSTAVAVLGIFTQLYWNYNVYKSKENINEFLVVMYAVMIWSEKLQFLVLPLFVIGGINADYLWRKFKRTLTERLQSEDQSSKVDELLHHMKRIDTSFKWIKPTVALTLVSFYLGMQMKNQNLNYWIGPSCNLTHWQA